MSARSTEEKESLNQYWYSAYTIEQFAKETEAHATRAAFLSTPSVFFSVEKELRGRSVLFDLDDQWAPRLPGQYVKYDFNAPADFPGLDAAALHGTFDFAVIDPPFITRECWSKYAESARLLLRPGGKILLSTVWENAEMLAEVLPGMERRAFQPSIPHLVYQYSVYTNYESDLMGQRNPEIPE